LFWFFFLFMFQKFLASNWIGGNQFCYIFTRKTISFFQCFTFCWTGV
jgi:hypothetical protein